MRKRYFGVAVFVVVVALAGVGVYLWHGKNSAGTAAAVQFKTPQEESNKYVRFDMEAFDDIKAQYWQTASEADLASLFQLSLAKAANVPNESLATSTRAAVAQMLSQAFSGLSTTSQEQLALQTVQVALYNLAPNGRDQLLTSQARTDLQNTVDNVNPAEDLYGELGLPSGASSAQVEQAYAQKSATLAATTSEAGKQELAKVEQAHATLSNPTNKAIYDRTGAQPTVFSRALNAHTLYVDISSVAPTTIQEFAAAIDAASTTPALTNLVIDLRGNIGGDLSFAQEFLALFFGPNQYAFDLFHQGDLQVQRTGGADKSSTLAQFKEIAVLTDAMTQSTAELAASALKHDRLAFVVGSTTRGWGSVEAVIPLQTSIDPNETYALELVEYLTVRYDGLPIEGNGVAPDVDTSKPDWTSSLSNYFTSPSMISALEDEAQKAPLH
ncbi:MAG TPA: S41 family peptidase [Candidatus Paceibacterota bacterium]|nr:S41 family peptidase [Candidatus Paceibacterota bacterium]